MNEAKLREASPFARSRARGNSRRVISGGLRYSLLNSGARQLRQLSAATPSISKGSFYSPATAAIRARYFVY